MLAAGVRLFDVLHLDALSSATGAEESGLTVAAAWSLDPRRITPVPVTLGSLP